MRLWMSQWLVACTSVVAMSAMAAELQVTVEGVDSATGKVMVALYDKAAGFPGGSSFAATMVPAKPGAVSVGFKDVPAGRYAVSAFHDLNGNQRLDRNMVGIPSEPYGFSRNARGKMGPPSFDDAAVNVGTEAVQLVLRIK